MEYQYTMPEVTKNMNTNLIYRGDCHSVLKRNFPENSIDLIYIDPPFSFDPKYARLWYDKETLEMFDEMREGKVKHYIGWMSKRLEQCHRVLKDTGSIYLHCDWKFGHYLKVEMDNIFNRNNFQNEIIWAYKSGGSTKKRFSRKHDTIFLYSKSNNYIFNPLKEKSYNRNLKPYRFKGVKEYEDEIGWYTLVNMKDVWNIDMVGRTSKERMGYFTQKPEELLRRIILSCTDKCDVVLDPFLGSGTTSFVAKTLGRNSIGIEKEKKYLKIIEKRMNPPQRKINEETKLEIKI
ncbi:MAG: site-specific DNA-methyltransferase [Nanoarchaeota archaeon]|nr:site-specific DNA-methyltransferase [Nanoarchaeota archaeon]